MGCIKTAAHFFIADTCSEKAIFLKNEYKCRLKTNIRGELFDYI
jgi:hypothetical protein